MSTRASQLREFSQPLAKENQEYAILGFMAFPIDILLLIARYMDYDDFENLALTCQHANAQFKLLLLQNKFNTRVFPARQFYRLNPRKGYQLVNLKMPMTPQYHWYTHDSLMTQNGKWLFILRRRRDDAGRWCLDAYEQRSLTPLKYRHRRRDYFDTSSPTLIQFDLCIVGGDHRSENPGLYLADKVGAHWLGLQDHHETTFRTTRQMYSWHLHDQERNTLKIVGERLPFSAVAVECRANDLQVYGIENGNNLRTLTLSHDGVRLLQDSLELALEDGIYQIKPSPNCWSLLLFEETRHKIRVLTKKLKTVIEVTSDLDATQNLTITDDGGTLFSSGLQLYSLDGSQIEGGHYYLSFVHSGDGRLVLKLHDYTEHEQVFPVRKRLPWPVESQFHTLLQFLQSIPDNLNYFQILNRFIAELPLRRPFNIIRHSLQLRDPNTLFMILDENCLSLEEHFLLQLSDIITFLEILELAADPKLKTYSRTGVVELAMSPRGQALRDVVWGTPEAEATIRSWFNDPIMIATNDQGIICSSTFLWGTHDLQHNNKIEMVYFDLGRLAITSKGRKIKEAFTLFGCGHPRNPFIALCALTADNETLIDVFCESRNPRLDKYRHELIPRKFAHLLETDPTMENYLVLAALLKKIIGWTSLPSPKARLEATLASMLKAVDSNPSLRHDMQQLLTTRFYGQESVQECLQGSPYYQDIMRHFGNQEPEAEETRRVVRGCGFNG